MGEAGQGLGRAVSLSPGGTILELARAGLRDRDYENLSTSSRLEAHARLAGDDKRLVCDCVDREPGLEIGRQLLATEAAAVAEGALIAAFATVTPRLTFHIAEDDQPGADAVVAALDELRRVAGPGGGVTSEIIRAPFKPDLKGYEAVPTLIVNAETLLHIGRILREGADRYRETGGSASPGTKWFQVTGCVKRPGIVELPLGITLRHLIEDVCGGIAEGCTLLGVIVGGVKGACFKEDELDLILDFDSVERSGGIIGSGAVAVLDQTDCIIDQAKRRIGFACNEDCGKCSLGREGSYQLREIVTDMTRGKSRGGDHELLREISRAMKAGCVCSVGRTAPNIILSTMDKFPEEYEAHMRRRLCRSLVCAQYVTFHILPDLCDGCGACAAECPEEAIEGGKKKIHVIDQYSCTKCARCHEVCLDLRKAVVKAGPVKPRTPKRPIPVGTWSS